MKKYLSTIGVSLMLALTATTLSAATLEAEEGISSYGYSFLLGQYKSALTSNNTSLMKSIKEDFPYGESYFLWRALSAAMKQAYIDGNIEALEKVKASALEAKIGFGNIDDLGEPFFKYGAGMHKWDQLIEDAKANQTK